MRIIGVNHSGYNTARNISSLPFKRYVVKKTYDIFKLPEHLLFRLTGKVNPLLFNLHQDFGLSRCDIFHFFNTVSFGRKPWVTTFETAIPRFGNSKRFFIRMGVKLIAGKGCKKLIAMSECAQKIELDFIKKNYPEYYDAIAKKLLVIYPSQKLLITDYAQKKLNSTLSFVIIGSEFFVKGGKEVLLAFDKVLAHQKDVKLYIVSRMEIKGFATEADKEEALDIINKHPDNIFYFPSLPNEEVLKLFLKCHVALLPTYADTFGYSVLEAQASGCPVITTDIRAMAELNNARCGWVIPVPRNEIGFAIINSPQKKQEFSTLLCRGLEKVILDIIEEPGQIKGKGIACLERIKEHHDPEKNTAQLEQIYDEAIVVK